MQTRRKFPRNLQDKFSGAKLTARLMFYAAIAFGALGYATTTEDQYWQSACAGLGGASIGLFLVSIVDAIFSNGVQDQVVEMQQCVRQLSEYLSTGLKSEEKDIKSLRRKYFQYHRTRYRGETYWTYITLNFGEVQKPNILSAKAELFDPEQKREIAYTVDAIVRDGRLIIFRQQDQEPREDLGICIFPNLMTMSSTKFGIILHKTWDDFDSVSPTIISERELHKESSVMNSKRLDEDAGQELEDMWDQQKKLSILSARSSVTSDF
ncbi:MAG: hypothetical protein F6K30_05205 [Cyanothece sp. SIO2G6]|nr:hypothetical protein [Cyanothece sp. SIO2G6]